MILLLLIYSSTQVVREVELIISLAQQVMPISQKQVQIIPISTPLSLVTKYRIIKRKSWCFLPTFFYTFYIRYAVFLCIFIFQLRETFHELSKNL